MVWRSSRIESVSFLYVNESSDEVVAVSTDSEESAEALSELASASVSLVVAPIVFDSEYLIKTIESECVFGRCGKGLGQR